MLLKGDIFVGGFFTLYYPFQEIWATLPGYLTVATRAVLPSPASACWVFSWFRNPTNSDMDYRIFNVRTWSDHLYVCVYTWGLGTLTTSQHNILDWKPLTNFSCAPDGAGISDFSQTWWWSVVCLWSQFSTHYDGQGLSATFQYKDQKTTTNGTRKKISSRSRDCKWILREESLPF